MRLLTYKTPVLALIFSIVAIVLLQAFSMAVDFVMRPDTSLNLFDRTIQFFYMPAWTVTFLCLPSRFFEQGNEPYRHFHKRKDRLEPAA
jgi:hypothetical protein